MQGSKHSTQFEARSSSGPRYQPRDDVPDPIEHIFKHSNLSFEEAEVIRREFSKVLYERDNEIQDIKEVFAQRAQNKQQQDEYYLRSKDEELISLADDYEGKLQKSKETIARLMQDNERNVDMKARDIMARDSQIKKPDYNQILTENYELRSQVAILQTQLKYVRSELEVLQESTDMTINR